MNTNNEFAGYRSMNTNNEFAGYRSMSTTSTSTSSGAQTPSSGSQAPTRGLTDAIKGFEAGTLLGSNYNYSDSNTNVSIQQRPNAPQTITDPTWKLGLGHGPLVDPNYTIGIPQKAPTLLDKIEHGLGSIGSTIEHGLGTLGTEIENGVGAVEQGIEGVYTDVKGGVTTVYDDAKGGVGDVFDLAEYLEFAVIGIGLLLAFGISKDIGSNSGQGTANVINAGANAGAKAALL